VVCERHGVRHVEWKCRFCCSLAVRFCWGTTHFCEPCHVKQVAGDYVTRKDKSRLPKCPGKEGCNLQIDHPPNGEEFSLGCSLCRNIQANTKSF